jgi:hypothetical protein
LGGATFCHPTLPHAGPGKGARLHGVAARGFQTAREPVKPCAWLGTGLPQPCPARPGRPAHPSPPAASCSWPTPTCRSWLRPARTSTGAGPTSRPVSGAALWHLARAHQLRLARLNQPTRPWQRPRRSLSVTQTPQQHQKPPSLDCGGPHGSLHRPPPPLRVWRCPGGRRAPLHRLAPRQARAVKALGRGLPLQLSYRVQTFSSSRTYCNPTCMQECDVQRQGGRGRSAGGALALLPDTFSWGDTTRPRDEKKHKGVEHTSYVEIPWCCMPTTRHLGCMGARTEYHSWGRPQSDALQTLRRALAAGPAIHVTSTVATGVAPPSALSLERLGVRPTAWQGLMNPQRCQRGARAGATGSRARRGRPPGQASIIEFAACI